MIKERPILFSAPMVRAILEGRKTQTRRIVKPQPSGKILGLVDRAYREGGHERTKVWFSTPSSQMCSDEIACPYGKPGDRLWVRETWAYVGSSDPGYLTYRATYPNCLPSGLENIPDDLDRWRPSIHMPRSASRILLEITNICVERLQDISEEDALAEGVTDPTAGTEYEAPSNADYKSGPITWFAMLWSRTYGIENWRENPWVWVVEFKQIKGG